MVAMTGRCLHTVSASREDMERDHRVCFHKSSKVTHAFQDGISFWIENRYGSARREMADNLRIV